jgi:hypothetical protein
VPTPSPLFTQDLIPHTAQPWARAHGLRVSGHWNEQQALVLRYTLSGPEPLAIRWPPAQTPGPADGLWQHSCFEAFVSAPAAQHYLEYNFSPSGQWARYRFSAERVRDLAAEQQTPAGALPINWDAQARMLQTQLPLADLPHSRSGWLLGLCAVLEHADGQLSYWALHHPQPQADFHHSAGRVLRLDPPSL